MKKERAKLNPSLSLSCRVAFTLIELLVVIAIIGILSGLIVISMNASINSANDAKRKANIDAIRKALVIYSALNGNVYPVEAGCNVGAPTGSNPCSILTNKISDLLPNPPKDPISGDYYRYVSDGTSFTVYAVLSNADFYSFTSSSGFTSSPMISCLAILSAGKSIGDGMYWIKPAGTAFQTYCDMTNGGWTRILTLVDNGAKTNNNLDKGIQFTAFRAVKASDHSVYQGATFSSAITANTGITVVANEASTKIMLTGPGGYGVWIGATSTCNWGSVTMFGAGYDGSCGTEANLRVGRNLGGSALLTERFNVELYVK
jgi:prepilin-type N-terminal cleavage/methylation domain-containing protein